MSNATKKFKLPDVRNLRDSYSGSGKDEVNALVAALIRDRILTEIGAAHVRCLNLEGEAARSTKTQHEATGIPLQNFWILNSDPRRYHLIQIGTT